MLVCPLCRIALGPKDAVCPRDGYKGRAVTPCPVPAALKSRFHILELFAHGDGGSSYLADDKETGRRGLLKVLAHVPESQMAERQRLRRELVKQAALGAPHVSTPLASGEVDGVTWIFREWLEGVSLRVRLSRSGALEQSEALTIAAQLAAGLDDLHRAGLLHRDIKPSHVFLELNSTQPARALLIDAGVCTMHELSGRGPVSGTPGYVAPEQLQGKLVSFRSDLYALGCVIYEMLTGRPAFPGGSSDAILAAQLTGEPPALPDDVPSAVRALLRSLLSRDPQERPFSAQKLRRTLDPFLLDGAHVTRLSPQTYGSSPEQRRSLAPGSRGTLAPAAPAAPSRIPPPPPKTPSSAPEKNAPPSPSRAPSLPPPAKSAARDATEPLDPKHLLEVAPAASQPKASVPPPRPSERPKADATQALDLDQLLEIVPPRETAPARPSVPPPRPSSVPPPVKSADMTQPIRLEQILAVAHTGKKDLDGPPVLSKGLAQSEERPSQPEPAQTREALAGSAPRAERPAPAHRSHAAAAFEQTATNEAPIEGGGDAAQPASQPMPEFDRAGVRRSPSSAPPPSASVPPPAAARQAKAVSSPAPTAPPAEPVRPRESVRPAAAKLPDVSASAQLAAENARSKSEPAPAAANSTLLGVAPAAQEPAPASAPVTNASNAAPTRTAPEETAAPPEAAESAASPGPQAPEASEPAPEVSADESPAARAPGEESAPIAAPLATPTVHHLSYRSEHPRTRRVGSPTTTYAIAAAAVLALGVVSVNALFGGDETETAQAPAEPERREEAKGAVGRDAPSAAALPALAETPKAAATDFAAAPAVPPSEPDTPQVEAASAQAEPSAEALETNTRDEDEASERDEADEKVATAPSRSPRRAERATKSQGRARSTKPSEKLSDEAKMERWAKARDEARAHYAAKRYAQAAEAYAEAAKYNPNHAGTFAGLGAARLVTGDTRGAIQAYQRAIQISPTTSGFHSALGKSYLVAGDRAKARTAYKRALALDPKNESAKQALAQLGE